MTIVAPDFLSRDSVSDELTRGSHLISGFTPNMAHSMPSAFRPDGSSPSYQLLTGFLPNAESTVSIPLLNIHPAQQEAQSISGGSAPSAWESVADIPNAHTLESAVKSCDAFLSGHKQSNHIVDKDGLMQDLHAVYQPGALHDPLLYGSRFRSFIILYLAQERYWKSDAVDEIGDSSIRQLYRQLALKDVCATISKENLVRVLPDLDFRRPRAYYQCRNAFRLWGYLAS